MITQIKKPDYTDKSLMKQLFNVYLCKLLFYLCNRVS